MNFARSERVELCDLLDAVGPDAPTLCAPWDAHDLAAHLWVRETDPLAASGLLARPLSGLTERRMAETRQRWQFAELVERIRSGPARFSVFSLPGIDEPANTTEFFIHHEDVRRAGEEPQSSRALPPEAEDFMWRRLKLLGRAYFRKVEVGVVLERVGSGGAVDTEDTVRVGSGSRIVTLIGKPSELMLFAHGRQGAAEVELVGEPDAIEMVHGTDLGH